jgi:hypothetical protein
VSTVASGMCHARSNDDERSVDVQQAAPRRWGSNSAMTKCWRSLRGFGQCSTDMASDSCGCESLPRVVSYSTPGHRPLRPPSIGNAHTWRSPNPHAGSWSSGHTNSPAQRAFHYKSIGGAIEDKAVKGPLLGRWPVQVSHRPEACCASTTSGAAPGYRKSHRLYSQGNPDHSPREKEHRDEARHQNVAHASPDPLPRQNVRFTTEVSRQRMLLLRCLSSLPFRIAARNALRARPRTPVVSNIHRA